MSQVGDSARTPQNPTEPPTLCDKCHGIFYDHTESGPRFTSHLKDDSPAAQCPRHWCNGIDFLAKRKIATY